MRYTAKIEHNKKYNNNVHFEGVVVTFRPADFDSPPASVIYARCEAEDINVTEGW